MTTALSNLTGRVVNAASGLPVPRALIRFNERAILTDHEGKFALEGLSVDTNHQAWFQHE